MTRPTSAKPGTPEPGASVPLKALMWWTGSLLGALVAMGTLHAMYVIPTILESAREIIAEEVDKHDNIQTHRGAVPRVELEARMAASDKRVEDMLQVIDGRLARIEARMDERK